MKLFLMCQYCLVLNMEYGLGTFSNAKVSFANK